MQIGYHPLPCHEIPKIDELLNIEHGQCLDFVTSHTSAFIPTHETKRKCSNMWA